MLAQGSIALGDKTVGTAAEARAILGAGGSSDARVMLRAQLLATLLNLKNGSDPMNTGIDIRLMADQAVEFLASHSMPVTGGHSDRTLANSLKDKLDAYNNAKSNCNESHPGGGRGDDDCEDDDEDNRDEDQGSSYRCHHSRSCESQSDCEKKSKVEDWFKKILGKRR